MSIFNPLSLITGGSKWLPLAAGAVLGIAVTSGPVYLYGRHTGASDERTQAEAKAAKAVISQLKERGLINEAVGNLDTVDLCIELGGVPDECRQ